MSWDGGAAEAKRRIRSNLKWDERQIEVVFVDSSSLTEKDTMDVWCNGQKLETTVINNIQRLTVEPGKRYS